MWGARISHEIANDGWSASSLAVCVRDRGDLCCRLRVPPGVDGFELRRQDDQRAESDAAIVTAGNANAARGVRGLYAFMSRFRPFTRCVCRRLQCAGRKWQMNFVEPPDITI
jgi:hypothetical protein